MAALLCVPSSGTWIGEDQLSSVDPTDAPTADPTPDPTPNPTVAPTATPTASPTATPTASPAVSSAMASPAVSSAISPAGLLNPEATEAANCLAVGKVVDEKRAKEREANVAELEAIGKKKEDIYKSVDAAKNAAENQAADTSKKAETAIQKARQESSATALTANVKADADHAKQVESIMAAEKVVAEKSVVDKKKIDKDAEAGIAKVYADSRALGNSRENQEWTQKVAWMDKLANDRVAVDLKKESQERGFEEEKKACMSKAAEDQAKAMAAADEVEKR